MWTGADRDPRGKATANLAHVVAVAGKILPEKFFFSANTFQDHEAECLSNAVAATLTSGPGIHSTTEKEAFAQ
jgi:hypothetical protein